MTARTGTCSGCDAKYKIPETFKGTKAKCKKCGGVVEIPPLEEAAVPEPAPAVEAEAAAPAQKTAAGPRKKAAPSKRGVRKTAARGRKGAAPSRRKPSRRRGADEEEGGGSQKWIWVIAGVSAVAIIVILVLLFSGGKDDAVTDDLAGIDETPETVEDTPAATEETGTEPAEDTTGEADEATDPEPADETPEETAPPPEPEEIDPVIKLDILPPIVGCDQETFDHLTQCFTDGFVKQDLPPWKRKTLMKDFEAADFEKVPILLNAFNGLDLLKSDDVVVAFRVAEMWNKLTGLGFVDVPIKGDTTQEEMEANLDLNVKNVYVIYNIWKKKIGDVDAQRSFFAKCEKYRRKAAAKDAEGN